LLVRLAAHFSAGIASGFTIACSAQGVKKTVSAEHTKWKGRFGMTKKVGSVTSARLLKNRPLDQDKDSAEVRSPGVIAQAAAELGPEHIEQPRQAELLAAPEEATHPVAVQNGRMLATYVGLGLERDKDGERLVHLNFSFPLEAAHNGHIPKKVKEAWEWLSFTHNKAIQIAELPGVTLDIYLDPKEKKAELHLIGAEFTKAIVQVIEEVGKGQAKMVTRFGFRLRVERTKQVIDWAAWHDGDSFWLRMPSTQKSIGE